MTLRAWILFAIFCGTAATLAIARPYRLEVPQPIMGQPLSSAETDRLVDMAVKYSRYSKPWFARPVVDVVPGPRFNAKVCGGEYCGILGYTASDERDVVHVIDKVPDVTAQSRGWTREEIIVHELVHWLQIKAGNEWMSACANQDADETEAYNAQYQFAVRELHMDHGFWKPDIYLGCQLEHRGHH
jgi:hypothetical protein